MSKYFRWKYQRCPPFHPRPNIQDPFFQSLRYLTQALVRKYLQTMICYFRSPISPRRKSQRKLLFWTFLLVRVLLFTLQYSVFHRDPLLLCWGWFKNLNLVVGVKMSKTQASALALFSLPPNPKGPPWPIVVGQNFPLSSHARSVLMLWSLIIDKACRIYSFFVNFRWTEWYVRLFEMSCSSSGSDFQTFSPPTRLKLKAGVLIVPGFGSKLDYLCLIVDYPL